MNVSDDCILSQFIYFDKVSGLIVRDRLAVVPLSPSLTSCDTQDTAFGL